MELSGKGCMQQKSAASSGGKEGDCKMPSPVTVIFSVNLEAEPLLSKRSLNELRALREGKKRLRSSDGKCWGQVWRRMQ